MSAERHAPRWVSDIAFFVLTALVAYLLYVGARRALGQPWAYFLICAWGVCCALDIGRGRTVVHEKTQDLPR